MSLFLWIDSCLAPSPLYPASECSINQSAVLKEEASFSVECVEDGEVLKSSWKKNLTHCSHTADATCIHQQGLKQADLVLGFSAFISPSSYVSQLS